MKFSIIFLLIFLKHSSGTLVNRNNITVMISQIKPFAFYENETFKGLEVDIINNFAKKFNLNVIFSMSNITLKKIFNNSNEITKFAQSNENSYAFLKKLNCGKLLHDIVLTNFRQIDIFMGAMEENLFTKNYFEASLYYYHDSLTWCVQKAKISPYWKAIFYLCNDPLVYLLLGLGCVIIIVVAYFLQQFEPKQKWDWNRFVVNNLKTERTRT